VGHGLPPGELQPVERGASRAPIQERGPRLLDRRWRTIRARGDRLLPGAPTPRAPGRHERDELAAADRAEGPPAVAAAGASARVQEVEERLQHGATLGCAGDTLRVRGAAQ